MTTLLAIAQQFDVSASQLNPLGNGLINDTFLVSTASEPLVLQRINRRVFKNPERIAANLTALDQHLLQKNAELSKLQLPKIIGTLSGEAYFIDTQGDFWRALSYVGNSESLEALRDLNDAQQAGFALAHFHRLLSDLPVATLHDTLPGFHITPEYLRQYRQVSAHSSIAADHFCQTFIEQNQAFADDLEAAQQKGLLQLRVTHGDPKLNNFLFDQDSREIISLVDLDTVKPGLVHYDIGDALRSCCHNDDDRFDMTVCTAWLSAYLAEAKAFFTEADFAYLFAAIRLIPFELGLRFYSDYLDGNRYFKTEFPEQNLQRAQAQFRLCADIIGKEPAIRNLVEQLKQHG
ncbi:aminoglycoside phosphotransferase family protein [Methylosoma difficile]